MRRHSSRQRCNEQRSACIGPWIHWRADDGSRGWCMGGRWAMTPVAGEERTEAMGEVARRRRFTTGAGVAGHLRHRRGRRAGQRRGRARVPRQPRQAQFPRVCHAPPPPDLDAGDGGGDDYLRLEALLESQVVSGTGGGGEEYARFLQGAGETPRFL
ncbi:hypothetical protein HU200_011616 [Digitaria exilis]|uniref:Uncharacterized protein n=1 Tax=Digitaria exilis TaxID=1010633 RepID=A0A835FGW3_9POAL|nr:hypothetical protein HU200_011616 [Digitaria exilis]